MEKEQHFMAMLIIMWSFDDYREFLLQKLQRTINFFEIHHGRNENAPLIEKMKILFRTIEKIPSKDFREIPFATSDIYENFRVSLFESLSIGLTDFSPNCSF